MISQSLLVMAIISVAAVTILATALLMLHAWRLEVRAQRFAEPSAHARRILISVVSGMKPFGSDDLEFLDGLPKGTVVSLVGEISKSVVGDNTESTDQLSRALGLTASAEKMAGSRLWWRRIAATRTLSIIDGGSSLRVDLLNDRHPLVRAHAAEWSGHGASSDDIDILISLLADHNGLTSFSAKDALIRLGTAAAPNVAEALNLADGEVADSLLEVAASVNDPRFLVGALRLMSVESDRTRTLAAELLGSIGGSEAQAALELLLTDDNELVRAGAARELGRLGHWRAASSLASCLKDQSWHVRRAAADSLRSIGAPGLLFLRKASASSEGSAADMAQQALDIHGLDESVSI